VFARMEPVVEGLGGDRQKKYPVCPGVRCAVASCHLTI
jgi:hypothetical protein